MPEHEIPYIIGEMEAPTSGSAFKTPKGLIFGWGTTVGNGVEGWAPGALFIDTDAAAGQQQWVNEGSKTTASWKRHEAGNIVLLDDETLAFGTGSDQTFSSDGTNLQLSTLKGVNFDEGLPSRFSLFWNAGERGKPGVNGDFVSDTEATNVVADRMFEVLGTNASSDDVTYNPEGGITFTTDGADGDGVILLPHLDSNVSPWTAVTWGTDRQVKWECWLTSGASIGNCIMWAGLKLTNTDVIATDADQVFFRYENGINSGKWQAVYSIGGTDTATDTGVTAAIGTSIHFAIRISSLRVATMYMDGTLVATSTALTDAVDLIPYIAVEADGAAEAKTLTIRSQRISRSYA